MALLMTRTMDVPVAISEVWKEYRIAPTKELRNLLILEYLPLVEYLASRIAAKAPRGVDFGDLVQAGVFGLKDAIASYDPSRSIKFETYAASRVRGSILDENRALDWVPRLARTRCHRHEERSHRFRLEHGRPPTDDELATTLGMDEHEFAKFRKGSRVVRQVGINAGLSTSNYEGDSDMPYGKTLVGDDGTNIINKAQRGDLKDLLEKGLNRVERLIVSLYYYENMTMKEIGVAVDMSESRVSQIHSLIIERWRSRVGLRDSYFKAVKSA